MEVYPARRLAVPAARAGDQMRVVDAEAAPLNINFRVSRQLQTEWCWAAVSASVADYFGDEGWSQCRVAAAETGGACCDNGSSPICNRPHFLDAALRRVGHLRAAAPGYLPPPAVAEELELDRPICLRVQWRNGEGHFLAIVGIAAAGNDAVLLLTDPIYGMSRIQGASLINGGYQAAGGRWTHSYVVQP